MLNPLAELNWNPGRRERRRFAASLIIGLPCVAVALLLVQRWRGAGWELAVPLIVAGAGAGVGSLLWLLPQLARPLYVAWHALAGCVGFVVGNALLAAVYLLLFTPIGLIRRVVAPQSFRKRIDRGAATYWSDARTPVDAARYYRQF